MPKCASCGIELSEGDKFCPECGTKIPQTRRCVNCGFEIALNVKFCPECGTKQEGTSQGTDSSGISMGDKNVIAGDVIGRKDVYNLSGNATIVHNDDETKKTAKCHICGSVVQRISGYDCPDCSEFTCEDCFDRQVGVCKNCVESNVRNREQQYKTKVIEFMANDNRIDADEYQKLSTLAKQLKITDFRAMELQDEVKASVRNKAEFTTFEKLNFDKAKDLFYIEGKTDEALQLIEPIYQSHKEDDKVLNLYLPILAEEKPEDAKRIIEGLKFDVLWAYLTDIEIAVREKDMTRAERTLDQATSIWPDSTFVTCHRIMYRLALYKHFNAKEWLDKAEELLPLLGKPQDRLELSWQIKVQCLVSEAKGEKPIKVDKSFCAQNQLYYAEVKRNQMLSEEEKLIKEFIKNSIFSDDGKTLVKYKGSDKTVIIPNSVTELGNKAFYGCTTLEAVTIPDSITCIADGVFGECKGLKSVKISDSVTCLGEGCFFWCTGLVTVTIPDSVSEIGTSAFEGCTSLTNVIIPDSVTRIGSHAFKGCTSLATVTIPDSVSEIGTSAFIDCTSLTNVIIPDSVTSIESCLFMRCTSLATVTIPDSVSEIGFSAFDGCTSLTNVIIPDSVTRIGCSAFEGCTSLATVTIPASVTEIWEDSFDESTSIVRL